MTSPNSSNPTDFRSSTMPVIPERLAGRWTTAESFWRRVDRTGDCWIWQGRTDEKGYGRVGYRRRQFVGAHRVSWALTHGGDLPKSWVLHRCDNPPCVNPDHLFLGDATDNNRDRQAKGRTKGWAGKTEHEHHAFKADTELVRQMLTLREAGSTQQQIADTTGISRGHVSKLLRGHTVAAKKGIPT